MEVELFIELKGKYSDDITNAIKKMGGQTFSPNYATEGNTAYSYRSVFVDKSYAVFSSADLFHSMLATDSFLPLHFSLL